MLGRILRWLVVGFVGLVLLTAETAFAAGVQVEKATSEQAEAAQAQFRSADAAYDAGHFDEALSGYQQSYELVASPNSSLMIARSLLKLERLTDAYRQFEVTVALADVSPERQQKYAQTTRAAESELANLKPRLGLVELELHGERGTTHLELNGRALDQAELAHPLLVVPGTSELVVTREDGKTTRQKVDVAAGQTLTLNVDLTFGEAARPPLAARADTTISKTHKPALRTWAYVAGGIGAAGLVTFATFGVLNNAKYGDLEESCPRGRCPSDRSDDISTGRTYQTAANVGLGVAIVGLSAGVVLYLLGDQPATSGARKRTNAIGHGGFPLAGRF